MKYLVLGVYLALVFQITGCLAPESEPPASKGITPSVGEQRSKPRTASPTQQKTNQSFDRLKKWAGKYPINLNEKDFANFFQDSKLKPLFKKALGEKRFKEFVAGKWGFDLIKYRDGYLTTLGTSETDDPPFFNYVLVVVNPTDGETHFIFISKGKPSVFSQEGDHKKLPKKIREEIFSLAEQADSSLILKIIKPPESFSCYLVTPKYANAEAKNRKYVLVVNDEGDSIININSKDIVLPQIKSSEHQNSDGTKSVVWIFGEEATIATVEMSIVASTNEGRHLSYKGSLTVSMNGKHDKINVIGMCYD